METKSQWPRSSPSSERKFIWWECVFLKKDLYNTNLNYLVRIHWWCRKGRGCLGANWRNESCVQWKGCDWYVGAGDEKVQKGHQPSRSQPDQVFSANRCKHSRAEAVDEWQCAKRMQRFHKKWNFTLSITACPNLHYAAFENGMALHWYYR